MQRTAKDGTPRRPPSDDSMRITTKAPDARAVDAPQRNEQCINQIVAARRHYWIMASTPSTRRQHDGVVVCTRLTG